MRNSTQISYRTTSSVVSWVREIIFRKESLRSGMTIMEEVVSGKNQKM